MSDAKHTPGPWKLIGKQGTAIWAGAEIIAQSSISRAAPRVAHANSLLMAAAPDLLEALQTSLPVMRSYFEALGPCDHSVGICNCDMARAIKAVAAAIARATGEQS